MSKPEIAEQQKAFLHSVFEQAPVLKEASDLAQGFIALVKSRSLDDFPLWLERASKSDCGEMRSFAQGIQQDLPAVTNAISLSWSNGQTSDVWPGGVQFAAGASDANDAEGGCLKNALNPLLNRGCKRITKSASEPIKLKMTPGLGRKKYQGLP